MNPTLFRSHSKLHFFNYKKTYMVHFQKKTEIPQENPKIH